eukprot:403359230
MHNKDNTCETSKLEQTVKQGKLKQLFTKFNSQDDAERLDTILETQQNDDTKQIQHLIEVTKQIRGVNSQLASNAEPSFNSEGTTRDSDQIISDKSLALSPNVSRSTSQANQQKLGQPITKAAVPCINLEKIKEEGKQSDIISQRQYINKSNINILEPYPKTKQRVLAVLEV